MRVYFSLSCVKMISDYTTLQQLGGLHDEADYVAREALFQHFLMANRFKDAALILSGINFDSTSFALSSAQKADTYLKCAGTRPPHTGRLARSTVVMFYSF
jgi:hypothetical protein